MKHACAICGISFHFLIKLIQNALESHEINHKNVFVNLNVHLLKIKMIESGREALH